MRQYSSFNPHTHEGCDSRSLSHQVTPSVSIHTPTKGVTSAAAMMWAPTGFQSTHPRRVWRFGISAEHLNPLFQSTHPRRVWRTDLAPSVRIITVSIHTPTKGVTGKRSMSEALSRCFNPHTHEGCDCSSHTTYVCDWCFNPHTHEGCDHHLLGNMEMVKSFNPHTHEGCDNKQIKNI